MPDITTSDLARFARQSDVELRVIVNGEGQPQIDERHGWLGGRLARGLKIAFGKEDRTQKQQQYRLAKSEVLKALKKSYGDEIGERAFRAGVGEMRDGQHRTSSDHPITGRHIQKMIEVAEREIAQIEGVRDFGRNGFRDQTGRAMTERATAFWMNKMAQGQGSPNLNDVEVMQQIQQSPSGRFKVGDLHYGLRSEPVPGVRGRMAPGLTVMDSVAQDLIRDIGEKFPPPNPGNQQYFAPEFVPSHGFWTIALELPKPLGGSTEHTIGICVDRDDPNTIRVFDANRREVAIPRDQFAGWLSAHIKDVYGTVSVISLFRAQERRLGTFERRDDYWVCDELFVGNPDKLDFCRAGANFTFNQGVRSGVNPDHQPPMYSTFWQDIERSAITIASVGNPIPLRIVEDNVDQMLQLVTGEDGQPDLEALKSLSCMLNQSMHNTLNDTTTFKVNDQSLLPVFEEDLGSISTSIVRNGNNLQITYTKKTALTGMLVQEDNGDFVKHMTSPWTDYVTSSTTIEVSLDELRTAGLEGRVPRFEFLAPPSGRLHIENYRGSDERNPNNRIVRLMDAIQGGEGLPGRWDEFDVAMRARVKGQELVRYSNDGWPISECLYDKSRAITLKIGEEPSERIPQELRTRSHERFVGVAGNENRAIQLSRLVDTALVDAFCEELGYAVGATSSQLNAYLGKEYEFSFDRVVVDNVQMVEITMSQDLRTSGFLDPPNDMPNPRIQGSMTIRIPLSELDNGHPENFTVVRRPHFEMRND
jgi:hypothetical protein